MNRETLRRTYLAAMQVTSWLPRVSLPFAAPSSAEVLEAPATLEPTAVPRVAVTGAATPIDTGTEALAPARPVEPSSVAADAPVAPRAPVSAPSRPPIELLRSAAVAEAPAPVTPAASEEAAPDKPLQVPPPRFALQLLRVDSCLLLVELPTGYAFQSRDPAYLLLKDLLRAAGLPDRPNQVGDGEPIRWPLLRRGNLDQGPQQARDYVQSVLAAEVQREPTVCVWLIGLPAMRFAGELTAEQYNLEQTVTGIGSVWALPGLELLMDEPQRKAELWRAMRRLMPRWKLST